MDRTPNDARDLTGRSGANAGATRRAVLAAGGALTLSALAGCSALDGLVDRGAQQVLGTTVSSPSAFYPGRSPLAGSASSASTDGPAGGTRAFRTSVGDIEHVPATVQVEGREFDLEGWSTSGTTNGQDYNSSRSNKPRSEWWAGPDDDDSDGDGYGDTLVAIQDIELGLLGHAVTAAGAVERRDRDEATVSLDAFINATTKALKKGDRIDRCDTDVCGTTRENMASAEENARAARNAVDDGDWDTAGAELAAVEAFVLSDIELLDDELVERRPGRPRFSDISAYMRAEPTIGERFTVCLPDAKLPGDRGSLAEELTPGRVLSYFAASYEEDDRHTPFHDRYDTGCCFDYSNDGCLRADGPVSLHRNLACQTILSAKLDTYRTENRGITGDSTEDGAVVSGAPTSADTDGKCVFVAGDGTLREPTSLDSWGSPVVLDSDSDDDGLLESVSTTLVCPVAVTPEDCPCPLPGLFYVRRIVHDDQIIFAGGWMLDEGALYEDSATLLFDGGATEVASVTKADVESDDLDSRIVEQFSRDRSQYGSVVVGGEIDDADDVPDALAAVGGKKGYDIYLHKKQHPESDDSGSSDGGIYASVNALDAPLVHLAGAGKLSESEKRVATGRIETGVINSGEEVDILGMGAEK